MSDSDAVDRLAIQLARMEARMDVKLDQLLTRDDDHETRIRKLEQREDPATQLAAHAAEITAVKAEVATIQRWRWLVTGAAAGIGSASGSLITSFLVGGP